MKVRVEDLIDSNDVAEILGLSSPRAVHVYMSRYPEMPRPVVDRGANRAKLWLREEITAWKKAREANRQS
jgi:glutathione-regulated potassium-efflux system ancillary protein KefG